SAASPAAACSSRCTARSSTCSGTSSSAPRSSPGSGASMTTVTTERPLRPLPGTPRWRQFADALLCRPDPAIDRRMRQLLGDDRQWRLAARLTPYDRKHALAVHDRLVAGGYVDADLLRAALLHDVGKADERARVGTIHRV